MATLAEIEKSAEQLRMIREALFGAMAVLEDDVQAARRRTMPNIRELAAKAKDAQAKLAAEIDANRALFDKPRTRTFHGIKVGLQKLPGSVVLADEAKIIQRIRAELPADQAVLLIRVKENVHKPAVADLSVADLKRLGIQVTADSDVVLIKDTTSEIEKLVAALLAEDDEVPA